MSVITIFKRKAPELGGGATGAELITFDAVFEEELDARVEVTTYPIESGATPADNIIILPKKYRLTGAISDTPLTPSVLAIAGAKLSNFTDGTQAGGIIAGGLASSLGFLGGSDGDRSTAALTALLKLMTDRKPFTLSADDIQLTNMVVTSIRRVRNPDNEGGLVFDAELQEMVTLDTIFSADIANPVSDANDPASSQLTNDIDKGEVSTQTPQASTTDIGDQV